ncbi:MAG: protein-L-isoaspartate O-methyltransferase [Phototrophicales bacterium]|nr:MAG: protein-L-isoaspartate O-methyltransferase [Phototrophicales bacterium]
MFEENFDILREQMIQEQIIARDIVSPRILDAMRRVPRHLFVPEPYQHEAYTDRPLPIGQNQTILEPYISAIMLEALQLSGHEVILEVGTGSGYQTALLAELGAMVFSMERRRPLAHRAGKVLADLNYNNVEIYHGDGSQGLADMGPYDAILVSAAAPSIPAPMLSQLRIGGRIVIPVGSRRIQYLKRIWLVDDEWQHEDLLKVSLMPLIGRYGFASELGET